MLWAAHHEERFYLWRIKIEVSLIAETNAGYFGQTGAEASSAMASVEGSSIPFILPILTCSRYQVGGDPVTYWQCCVDLAR